MSPRTKQQFKEIREEKMTLIMDVALQHFANEGYFRTTISHIARHAGISKGLMYNYFESKEALLKSIVHRSVNEIYQYLDINRDGYLSEAEFEFFVRRISVLLKEKRYFWRLLMQVLIQNDVRDKFFEAFPEKDSFVHPGHMPGDNFYPDRMIKLLKEYFTRKKANAESGYDPDTEFTMFLLTLEGFALTSIYSEGKDDENNEKSLSRIIRQFK